jgi:hypothetical protein
MAAVTPRFASTAEGFSETPLREIPAHTFARSMDLGSSGELSLCFIFGVSVRL